MFEQKLRINQASIKWYLLSNQELTTHSNLNIETVCLVVFFLERKKEFRKEMSKIVGRGIFIKKEWELYHI